MNILLAYQQVTISMAGSLMELVPIPGFSGDN